jgi:hypothetical protein
MTTPVKGDRFVFPGEPWPVFVEITRVARDGSWADSVARTWAVKWTKRQPLSHITAIWKRQDWTLADVDATEPPAGWSLA